MQLEQTLEMYQPRQRNKSQEERIYTIVDLGYLSASVLYGSGPLKLGNSGPLRLGDSGPLKIRDFPNSGFQLHIHGSGGYINEAGLKRYGESKQLKRLTSYDAAMADLFADSLEIEKILRQLKIERL